jgi:sugar phosphate isomerase/epimerase
MKPPTTKQIGVITDEISPSDTLGAMEAAAHMGMGFVDLRSVFGTGVEGAGRDLLGKIKARQKDLGLGISVICSSYGKCDVGQMGSKEQWAKLEGAMAAAEFLGTRTVRIFPGFHASGPEEEALEHCRKAVQAAEKRGMVLAIEHEPITLSRNAALVSRIVKKIASPSCKILFEPANLYLSADDVFKAWEISAPDCIGFHVKDAAVIDRKTHAHGGFVRIEGLKWTCLGDGEVPWPALLEAVLRSGYAGTYTIELHCGPSAARVGMSLGRLKEYLRIKSGPFGN